MVPFCFFLGSQIAISTDDDDACGWYSFFLFVVRRARYGRRVASEEARIVEINE